MAALCALRAQVFSLAYFMWAFERFLPELFVFVAVPGVPAENAFAESFFKTVKWEEVYVRQYQTVEEAQASLQMFLEDVYNAKRLHSSLGYVPPDEFELKYAMCSCLSGLDFLEALQLLHSTKSLSLRLVLRNRFEKSIESSGLHQQTKREKAMHAMNYHQQWNTPSFDLRLQPDEVHVWRAPLVVPESVLAQLNHILSGREAARAMSFRFMEDRRRWIVAHGVLRILLSRYVRLDPSLLHFDFHPYGKPFLAFPILSTPLQFNLSHSRDLALYAFTYARQVGIDVEYKRADLDYEALARVSFSLNEQAVLRTLPNDVKQEAFYTCWTRKEAYIKAKGRGMAIPLDQFDVSFLSGEPATLLQSRGDPHEIRRWALRELAPGNDYAGALVVEGGDWSLSCWQWQGNANA